jgi:putative ATP-dependent endonuclease of the OLD family
MATEGVLGLALLRLGADAPRWNRSLERSLGRVRPGQFSSATDGYDRVRMIYLPALRNPVDELSRRETRVLIELLRAEQLRRPSTGSLAQVPRTGEAMLSSLTTQQLVMDVQGRIAENLKTITGGVREHYAFIGTQRVDDAYLAWVLELLLATLPDPQNAVRLAWTRSRRARRRCAAHRPDPAGSSRRGPRGRRCAAASACPPPASAGQVS